MPIITSAEKLKLFELLREKKGLQNKANAIPQAAAVADYYPLSFAQQRLWFLDQLFPGSPLYNIPTFIRARGRLNLRALEKCFSEIVSRHKVLRTTFSTREGQPVQIIAPAAPQLFTVVDLSELPSAQRESEAKRLAARQAVQGFDLSTGPLLRVCVVRLSPEDHVVLLTMHHIVSDGWSMGVLVREVVAHYQAFVAGQSSPLPPLPIQYVDYAVWQRERLNGEAFEQQVEHWKKTLAGVSVLELPLDHPRASMQSNRGASVNVHVGPQVTARLKELAQGEESTLFMVLIAAWQVLLMRYTGQEDITVGTPIVGRTQPETERLIGFFINMLVLRTDLTGAPSFRQLTRRVREVVLAAFAHQDVPFEKLVEELHPERDLRQTPLFQTVMALQNVPEETAQIGDLQLTPLNAEGGTAKFDLMLGLIERAGELMGGIEYKTELFDAATIERLGSHFEQLLECIAANPDERIDRYPLLSTAERQQLLVEWNDTRKEFASEATLHELFEAQVRRTPNAIALSYNDTSLTYLELNERSNQLAHYLRSLGVGPDIPVALCLERGIEMIVGILGVLKAGGAYLPLDPVYPGERLAFMLDDAKPRVLVTQQGLLDRLPADQMKVVCIDAEWEIIAAHSNDNPPQLTTSDLTAYIIYTSGSTGRPKGTLVTHLNVTRLLTATESVFQFKSDDVWTLFHSYAFDFSVWEIWGALLYGGRLVVVPYLVSRTPHDFYSLLCREGVTVLNQTPSAFRQLITAEETNVEKEESEKLKLRLVIFGGEALEIQTLRGWFARHGDQRPLLVNMYGITETTVHVTWRLLRSEDVNDRVGSPIGIPLEDLQVYVLDRRQELVPVGVWGELYVGGGGVCRGYLNRPELTAQRFIPNPFGANAGSRLYRTGDVGRYLPDGELEYLGRADAQVKVRGFRIELGEIESVLASHPAVRQCIVTARTNEDGVRLVAYVVSETDERQVNGQLRQHLLHQLPDYMVPSDFVFLEALPLTPNGKVNRQALPAPGQSSAVRREEFVAPRDTLELKLANIWEEVLKIQPIGVMDDFFELGGHSLMAVRLSALVETTLGKRIPLTTLFKGATVEQLANLLRGNGESETWSPLVEIQKGDSRRPLFLIHAVGGSVLSYLDLARHIGAGQPIYGLHARGLDAGQQPHTRIEDMAAEYLEAIRMVQPDGPYLLGGWSMGGVVAFEIACQLQKQNEQVALLGLIDSVAPSTWKTVAQNDSELRLLLNFAQDLGFTPNLLSVTEEELLPMSSEERLSYLEEQAKSAKLIPEDIDHSRVVRLYEVFKTNIKALQQYEPAAKTRRITLISSEQTANTFSDSTLGWNELSTEGVEVFTVPGSHHYSIVRKPAVENLAQQLKACIAQAETIEQAIPHLTVTSAV
jgi:amino acid adenylation domain-containing protein